MSVRSSGRVRTAAVVTAAGVVVAMAGLASSAQSANAATVTYNPFDVAGGFTVLARGDAFLDNPELEGSLAVLGTIATGNRNGYPLIHQAAGIDDYAVPTIDGRAVRLLADRFVGAGSFDVSNRNAPTEVDLNATVALVDVDGLVGSSRSGGVGDAAGLDFLRVTNPAGGFIDLKAVPYAGSDVADYATALTSVASYFPDLDAQIDRANTCLDAMYGDPQLSNQVTVEIDGGMAYLSGFSTTMPNVIDYDAIAGRIIKLDRAGGYVPTAQSPLVIRVAAGTTTIGRLNFEGWSSNAGQQQAFARSILLDMSQVRGAVTIDGLEMGALWAPDADLVFSSNITTNGQWLAQDVTTSGAGEIHHHTFDGQLLCDSDDETVEPTTDPTTDPTTEPTTDPTSDPTTEPTTDPTTDPTTEPTTTEPSSDPTTDSVTGDDSEDGEDPTAPDATDDAAPSTPEAGGTLPDTGDGVAGPSLAIASALLLAGAVVLVVRRRSALR